MAQYKVIQDVEAEDKLVGPLTLKGFIYAATAFILGFINFRLLVSGLGVAKILLFIAFLPPMVLFAVLASPLGRDQPTEVWLLAKVRFFFKPKQRVWDQSGVSKLVTITAPKKPEKVLTKGLNENEMQNRLQTLAATMDSRGWAIKNLNMPLGKEDSDRLITPTNVSVVADGVEIDPADDMLDEENNPTAQNFNQLISERAQKRKVEIANQINSIRKGSDQYQQSAQKSAEQNPSSKVTPRRQADKLELSQSGSALSVASVAKLANRNSGEVVVELH